LNKYHKLQGTRKTSSSELIKEMLIQALKKEPEYKSRFLITQGAKMITISIEEVAYFYSEEKISFLVNKGISGFQ
jgi:DNA-binding LytR/AlgR family response regulator